MTNSVNNEYHVWLKTVQDNSINWEEYKQLVVPKLEEAIKDFVNSPLQLLEYSRSGGFLTAKDEVHYKKLHETRQEFSPKLIEAYSVEKINNNEFAIVCNFSKLLDVVPDRKQLEGKYLFDYTEDELKLNDMYEVTNELIQKFKKICAFPEVANFDSPEYVKVTDIAFKSEFLQVSSLSELQDNKFEEKQKVRRVI